MNTVTVLGTIIVLPVLFVVPGWMVLRRLGLAPLTALYCGFGLTAAYAGAAVGLAVLLPWSVRATCLGGLAVLLAGTVSCGVTAPRPLIPARSELRGVAVFLVAFAAAASFVAVPSQPAGTWAPGTAGARRVDTPRWQGMPSDNILPYRAGQVALFKETGQLRDRFGDGWWISDRTPLVGLDFAFTVGALGVHMRSDNPVATTGPAVAMVVKDRYAWWLYNLVAVMLATASVLGVFFLALVWRGNARLATAVYIARLWPRDRPFLLRTVLPYVVVAILAAGFPDTWSSQSAYPLIGLLAIFAGEMLLAVTARIRWILWGAIAFELLTVAYVCEYSPFNASAATIALFAVVGIGAHLTLLAALGRTIGLWSGPIPRRQSTPRPAMSPS